jgi:hypothetical protein
MQEESRTHFVISSAEGQEVTLPCCDTCAVIAYRESRTTEWNELEQSAPYCSFCAFLVEAFMHCMDLDEYYHREDFYIFPSPNGGRARSEFPWVELINDGHSMFTIELSWCTFLLTFDLIDWTD